MAQKTFKPLQKPIKVTYMGPVTPAKYGISKNDVIFNCDDNGQLKYYSTLGKRQEDPAKERFHQDLEKSLNGEQSCWYVGLNQEQKPGQSGIYVEFCDKYKVLSDEEAKQWEQERINKFNGR